MSPMSRRLLVALSQRQAQNTREAAFFVNDLSNFSGDAVEVSEAWEELQQAGLVVLAVKGGGHGYGHYAYVTARGREWLGASSAAPYPEDSEGFLKALRTDPKLDPFVETVVAEALWAHEHRRPVSALVCLCAAAERMVRLVDDATQSPKPGATISSVYDSLDKRITGPARKRADVIAFFATTFTALRDARNKAAHEAAITELPKVRRFLLQYLDWHEAAAKLRDNPAC